MRISKPGHDLWEGWSHSSDNRFESCERCLRAGADCINTTITHRNHSRTERLRSLSLAPSSEIISSHSPISSNTNTYERAVGSNSGNNDERRKRRCSRTSESTPARQPRTDFQESLEERPRWRPIELFPNDLENGNADQLESVKPRQHASYRNDGSTNSRDSPSTCPLDTQEFSTADSPISKRNSSLGVVDRFDFGIRLDPELITPHDSITALMDILCTTDQSTEHTPYSTLIAESVKNPSGNSEIQTIESKQDCLNRLSELSSQLLKDFNGTSFSKLSDVLSFSPCSNSRIDTLSSSIQKGVGRKNTIGSVLESSQTFLNILQHLKEPTSDRNSRRSFSAASECSYSEYWDENDIASTSNQNPYSGTEMAMELLNPVAGPAPNTTEKVSHDGTVDMPTTLTILTCYTWLLQSYDGIFSLIYTSLLSQPKLSLQSIPAILPGLHIGGFELDYRKDMQIEILIQVSSRMLEFIEETLGITVISQPQDKQKSSAGGGGILDTASASALLDIMFKQKDLAYAKSENGRVSSVKQTMDNIREILRGNGA